MGTGGPQPSAARRTAERLLGRREHGREELKRKLLRRGFSHEEVRLALDELQARGLLDDPRCAEALARFELERGHGLAYIRAKLRQRGLSGEEGLPGPDAEAASLSALVRRRGIDRKSLTEPKERAKIIRFLRGRGYGGAALAAVLGSLPEEE